MDFRYLKNVGIYVISSIAAVLVIAYIVYHAVKDFNTAIETMVSDIITERDTINLEAYIFRDESIIYLTTDGSINYIFGDGDKIAVESVVAHVYPGGNVNSNSKELLEINKKIDILENSNLISNITTMDTTSIDAQINQLMNIIKYRMEIGDIDYALYKKDELLVLLNKRSRIIGVESDYNDKIQVLTNQKNQITTGDNTAEWIDIVTDKAGYFYSVIDGYENIMSSKNIGKMTVDDFEKCILSEPELFTSTSREYSIGKIVTNYKWYIACSITNENLRNFIEGKSYNVVFPYNNDTVINMVLERIVQDPTDNTVVLVFGTGSIPDGFNFYRKQNVEIIKTSYTGYKVPISSVHITDDGRQGVYVLDGSVVKFKEIVPLIESNGFFIVEAQNSINDEEYYNKLAQFDLIITKGTKLYEGKTIDY